MVNREKPGWDAYLALLSLTELGVIVEAISVNVDGAKNEGVSDGGCTMEDAHLPRPSSLLSMQTTCSGTWKNF